MEEWWNGNDWGKLKYQEEKLFQCYFRHLLQALQIHYLKILDFSTTSFHLTRFWVHFVQPFIFIIIKSSFIS